MMNELKTRNPNPMSRIRTEALAREIATERGLSYGLSVFDGWYYVGTPKQLALVGASKRNPLTRRKTVEPFLREHFRSLDREEKRRKKIPKQKYQSWSTYRTLGSPPRDKRNPIVKSLARDARSMEVSTHRGRTRIDPPRSGMGVRIEPWRYGHELPGVVGTHAYVTDVMSPGTLPGRNPLTRRNPYASYLGRGGTLKRVRTVPLLKVDARAPGHGLRIRPWRYETELPAVVGTHAFLDDVPSPGSGRNPLTRRETAEVLLAARSILRDRAKVRQSPESVSRTILSATKSGAASALRGVARDYGQAKEHSMGMRVKVTARRRNPRVVGHSGNELVFNGSRAQAAAYARAHGLSAPQAVGIRKRARV